MSLFADSFCSKPTYMILCINIVFLATTPEIYVNDIGETVTQDDTQQPISSYLRSMSEPRT